MTALRNALFSVAMASATPALAQTTEPQNLNLPLINLPHSFTEQTPVYGPVLPLADQPISYPEIESPYALSQDRHSPFTVRGNTTRTELRNPSGSMRNYIWSYEVMGREVNGYSMKRSFTDAAGLRARYVEIGVTHPLTDDSTWNIRVGGARYSGQTGPERIGTGVIATLNYRIAF